jgi:hypothetical protein
MTNKDVKEHHKMIKKLEEQRLKQEEDELAKKCPTCGSEITGISEVFDSNGKKISKKFKYEDSYTNEKEHKFALKGDDNES